MSVQNEPCIFILGLSSDIGRELARRYLAQGWRVWGTYRHDRTGPGLDKMTCFPCDVTDSTSVQSLMAFCREVGLRWDVFVGAVGTEKPIGPFFNCDFNSWEQSIQANALGLLRVLHGLYSFRAAADSACVLFAGTGTNNAAVNYSAYSASKIFLIKMCEILAAEEPDLNAFIIGPGVVRTKIHRQTLDAGRRSGANYEKVVRFLESSDPGVSHDEIFECINWCIEAGRSVVGGRNISLVHDAWRHGGERLKTYLRADEDMYKLRRYKNAYLPISGSHRD